MTQEAVQSAFNLAFEHQSKGNLTQAKAVLSHLSEEHPEIPDTYIALSNLYILDGENSKALDILTKGNHCIPNNIKIVSALSPLQAYMGDIQSALEQSKALVENHPDSAQAHFSLAAIYFNNKEFSQSLSTVRTAVELDSSTPDTLYLFGNILKSNQLKSEALDVFYRCTQIAPNWPMPYIAAASLEQDFGRLQQAEETLHRVVKQHPDYAEPYKRLGILALQQEKISAAEGYFKQAISLNPQDSEPHLLLSHIYRDLNNYEEAVTYLNQAMTLNPDLYQASQYAQKIPQWHFDMLADVTRNDAFEQAILHAVKPNMKILEIGTGSGLLSMMAARAGATHITTCEQVPELANIAKQIISANGYDSQINVIEKCSDQLKVGTDMPEKADLLICEILDAGLLGEHVIPSLRHAKQHLLKPDAKIIPYSAEIHAVAIESQAIRLANPIKSISGFDLSKFNIFKSIAPYNAIQLENIPHKKVSEALLASRIDFNNLPEEKLGHHYNATQFAMTITQTGTIDAICFWFVLNVDDNVSLSTAPQGDTLHWRQALTILPDPVSVAAGDQLTIELRQSERNLTFIII